MANTTAASIAGRIRWTHERFLSVTEDLAEVQMRQQPSSTAPPIGWHVFHVARWTDRFQASLLPRSIEQGQPSALPDEIWVVEGLATQWGLRPGSLGLLETGQLMDIAAAVSLASLGSSTLLDYARRAMFQADQMVSALSDEQLEQSHLALFPQLQIPQTGRPFFTGERFSSKSHT
jgi:hypothetical protein